MATSSPGFTGLWWPTNVLPEHRILIWTRDQLVSGVLLFALRRLGYSCAIIHSTQEWQTVQQQNPPGPDLFIFGPAIALQEATTIVEGFASTRRLGAIFLAEPTLDQSDQESITLSEQSARLLMPFDVRVLNDLILFLLGLAESPTLNKR